MSEQTNGILDKSIEKKEFRRQIKQRLEENKAGFVIESQVVCEKLLTDKAFREASVVLAYMPLPDEVDVIPVIKGALLVGKKVAIPRVIEELYDITCAQNAGKMLFYYLDDASDIISQTKEGYCGIAEPSGKNRQFSCDDDFDNVLVLVPGRAFTKNGARLGRGKGFYDRFLSQLINDCSAAGKKVYTIGVCFSCQLVDSVPTEQNDISVDRIVSFSD